MWIHYVKRLMANNENIKEDWYGKWWNIIANEFPIQDSQQSSIRQNESFITKQLKVIREKSKADQRTQINTIIMQNLNCSW